MPSLSDSLAEFVAYIGTRLVRDEKGEAITPPALPLPAEEHAAFITGDCIRVTNPEHE